MKTRLNALFVAALLLCTHLNLNAQLVADGGTLDLTTATNLWPGDLIVGTNGGNTTLNIIGLGGAVTNFNGRIGFNPSSTNNRVTVQNSGAVWTNFGLIIGFSGSGNTLLITNGATVQSRFGNIGLTSSSSNNLAVVTGLGSAWNNQFDLNVGSPISSSSGNTLFISNGGTVENAGDAYIWGNNNQAIVTGPGSAWNNKYLAIEGDSGCLLLITNGGTVTSSNGSTVGSHDGASDNRAVVTGPGSAWNNGGQLIVGGVGSVDSSLLVSNGATLTSLDCQIGEASSNSQVVVTGPGSLWTNSFDLTVGNYSSGNTLLITDGAHVAIGANTLIGGESVPDLPSTNNLVHLDGGNFTSMANLDVFRGSLQLDSGTITAETLLATNGTEGTVIFNGGTLSTTNSTIANGQPLVVGNGASAATYQLLGDGLHTFNDGITVAKNARLEGDGTLAGNLTLQTGSSLSVGASVGLLVLSNSPVLQGAVLMEITKSGSTLTNDQLQVMASLTYGGSVTVTNLGPDPLVAGDTFPIFSASSYGGAFSSITLPPVDPGLTWTNRLLVDGSIAVVPQTPPTVSGMTQSGADLIFSVTGGSPGGGYDLLTATNIALPLTSWTTNSSGLFDWLGNITVTNAINLNEPERYFRVSVP